MKIIISALTALMLLSACSAFAQPGSLDNSFSKDGKVKSSLLGSSSSIAIQQDGKILIQSGFSVIRFKQNGTIDKSFGIDGKASTSFEGFNAGSLLVLQPDGKIIVAGFSIDNADIFFISLARFNTNGTLDSSFGVNGQVKTDANYYTPTDITISHDDKILITTTSQFTFIPDILLIEYSTDGSFYNEFGYDGGPGTRDISNALAIQSSGKIVVTGSLYNNDSLGSTFALLRFKSNGLLDNSFGSSGKTILNDAEGKDLALQSNDKIIAVAGDSILRFSKNGLLDSSFGINGKAFKVLNGAIAIQPDNKIVIAGILNNDFALGRYKANGKLDKTFGANGIVTTDFGGNDVGSRVAIQTDGKIVVAGSSQSKCAVARYIGDVALFNNNTDDIKTLSQNVPATIRIYPNPVKSILNIEFDAANKMNKMQKRISVYDVNGKLLITRLSDSNTQIDIMQLTAGTYFIKINDEDGKLFYSGKVIKQ